MGRKRIKDLPGFKRPREKLLERGPQALTDVELLVRTAMKEKAPWTSPRRSWKGPDLPRWSVEGFRAIPGIGEAKGCQIVAAFELARRFAQREVFAEAIADRAAAVILANSHPSGRLERSPGGHQATCRGRTDLGDRASRPHHCH